MKDRDEVIDPPEQDTPRTTHAETTVGRRETAGTSREPTDRPTVREFLATHPRAQSRLHREAEAMEFDPEHVYAALERVQECYDAFEGAERRPIVDHGDNYVAFGLNGSDWHALFDLIQREVEAEEKSRYVARVVTKVMSDITGENWHSHTSLPLVLAPAEIRDVLAYHEERYDPS